MKQKVNIGISKETHAKAKIISVLQGTTLNEYLAQAIEKAVEKDKGILAKIKP
jgi:predicted HicB family RNase H-like nuclease